MRAMNILTCSILPRDGSRSLAIRGTFTFASLSILWPGTLLETAAPTVCYGTRGSGFSREYDDLRHLSSRPRLFQTRHIRFTYWN
jgi:hypothetical protein